MTAVKYVPVATFFFIWRGLGRRGWGVGEAEEAVLKMSASLVQSQTGFVVAQHTATYRKLDPLSPCCCCC